MQITQVCIIELLRLIVSTRTDDQQVIFILCNQASILLDGHANQKGIYDLMALEQSLADADVQSIRDLLHHEPA